MPDTTKKQSLCAGLASAFEYVGGAVFTAVAFFLIIAGIAFSGLMDPSIHTVYQIESIKDGQVKMVSVSMGLDKARHRTDTDIRRLNYFSSDNQEKLKVGSFCYFFHGGSDDLITAVITDDKAIATAWAAGMPGGKKHWSRHEFERWVYDPLKYNQLNANYLP